MELSVSNVIETKSKYKNYKKTDEAKLKEELRKVDWQFELKHMDVNETLNFIKSEIEKAIKISTPTCTTSGKKNKRFIDKYTLETVRQKHSVVILYDHMPVAQTTIVMTYMHTCDVHKSDVEYTHWTGNTQVFRLFHTNTETALLLSSKSI